MRRRPRSRKVQLHKTLSKQERLLAEVHEKRTLLDQETRAKVDSLMRWYLRNHDLTRAQYMMLCQLNGQIRKAERDKIAEELDRETMRQNPHFNDL